MDDKCINFDRLNYLLSLELSSENLIKRTYRAKQNNKRDEYYCLCLVKAKRDFDKKWDF